MDGAFFSYFKQLRSLLVRQGTCEFELTVNAIKNRCFRLTASAVVGVNLCMPETHDHSFERPVLPRAYIPTVMEVQAPRAARSRSYGDGPVPVPPEAKGSSAHRGCGPATIACA
jgi:hypothetical protein